MLACARIGVINAGILGGFSSEAIKERVYECPKGIGAGGELNGGTAPLEDLNGGSST